MAGRRDYLVGRLSRGEITLEEARELFQQMDRDIDSLRSSIGAAAVPPPPPPPPPPTGAPGGATSGPASLSAEDILLLVGPMAGIFAALLKRSRERS